MVYLPFAVWFAKVSHLGFELPGEQAVVVRYMDPQQGRVEDRVDTALLQVSR